MGLETPQLPPTRATSIPVSNPIGLAGANSLKLLLPYTPHLRIRVRGGALKHIKQPTKVYQSPPRPTAARRSPPKPTEAHQSPPKPTEAHQSPPKPTKAHQSPPQAHQSPPQAHSNPGPGPPPKLPSRNSLLKPPHHMSKKEERRRKKEERNFSVGQAHQRPRIGIS